MKRSEIDAAIDRAKALAARLGFALPSFALDETASPLSRELRLGWDVTDFGSDDFARTGAVLLTMRNGLPDGSAGTPYAEKLMFFLPGQYIPYHYHLRKTEDIINRGGGTLRVYLRSADGSAVGVFSDARLLLVPSGEYVDIAPGDSITLTPGACHRLGAAEDAGELLAGEVSSVNDDETDNVFPDGQPRFPGIDEDRPARHRLLSL